MKKEKFESIVNSIYGTSIGIFSIYSVGTIFKDLFYISPIDSLIHDPSFIRTNFINYFLGKDVVFISATMVSLYLARDTALTIYDNIKRKKLNQKTTFEIDKDKQKLEKIVNNAYKSCLINIKHLNDNSISDDFNDSFINFIKKKYYFKRSNDQVNLDDLFGFNYLKYGLIKLIFKSKYSDIKILLNMIYNDFNSNKIMKYWESIKQKYDFGVKINVLDSLIKEYAGYKLKTDVSDLIYDLKNNVKYVKIDLFNSKNEVYKLYFNYVKREDKSNFWYIIKKSKDFKTISKESKISNYLRIKSESFNSNIKIPKIIDVGVDDEDNEHPYYVISEVALGYKMSDFLRYFNIISKGKIIYDFLLNYSKFMNKSFDGLLSDGFKIKEEDYVLKINNKLNNLNYDGSDDLDDLTYFFFNELNNLPKTIVHGDLHPGNILVLNSKYSVFDFEDTVLGNQLYDISFLIEQQWNEFPLTKNLELINSLVLGLSQDFHLINDNELNRIILKNLIYADLFIGLRFLSKYNASEKTNLNYHESFNIKRRFSDDLVNSSFYNGDLNESLHSVLFDKKYKELVKDSVIKEYYLKNNPTKNNYLPSFWLRRALQYLYVYKDEFKESHQKHLITKTLIKEINSLLNLSDFYNANKN